MNDWLIVDGVHDPFRPGTRQFMIRLDVNDLVRVETNERPASLT